MKLHKKERNEVGPLPKTLYKNQLKWTKGLNVNAQTMKRLEENIAQKLHDSGFGQDFLDDTKGTGNNYNKNWTS